MASQGQPILLARLGKPLFEWRGTCTEGFSPYPRGIRGAAYVPCFKFDRLSASGFLLAPLLGQTGGWAIAGNDTFTNQQVASY